MQQHNVPRSLPTNRPGTEIKPRQGQHLTAVGGLLNVDRDRSLDLTLEKLTQVIGCHQIRAIDPVTQYRLAHRHHLINGNLQILDLQWQGAFHLEQDSLDNRYILYLVLAGSLSHQIDTPQPRSQSSQTVAGRSDTATIVGPSQTVTSHTSQAGKALIVAIERESIDAALSTLLDRPLKQPIVFRPSIDLTSELGQSLKKLLQFLWESTQDPGTAIAPLVLQKLEQALLACAIEGLPSNYTEELLYQTDGALACHVRKARAFIESHLHEDIKLGDIAAATQVCSRLLQKAFSHHCGCSPMRFLTQSRLQRIRQELEAAPSDTKIVDVMMQYGFTQGGKFAKEYQQLFGEKPSETLKRRRQFNAPESESPLWQQIDDPRSAKVIGGVNPACPNQTTGSSFWSAWRRFFRDRTNLNTYN